jgi:hypothetical protein
MRVKYELGNVHKESIGTCLKAMFQYLSEWGDKAMKKSKWLATDSRIKHGSSWIRSKKLIPGPQQQPIKKFAFFYGTGDFIFFFTRALPVPLLRYSTKFYIHQMVVRFPCKPHHCNLLSLSASLCQQRSRMSYVISIWLDCFQGTSQYPILISIFSAV